MYFLGSNWQRAEKFLGSVPARVTPNMRRDLFLGLISMLGRKVEISVWERMKLGLFW